MSPLSTLGGAVSLNLALRAFSFALTILVTRVSSPDYRGATFQVEMVSDTTSFLAKDAIRSLYAAYGKALSSGTTDDRTNNSKTGLLYLSLATIPMGLLVMAFMELLALVTPITPISGLAILSGPAGVILPAVLYLTGIAFEFAAEPLLAASAAAQELQSRVWADALSVVASKTMGAAFLTWAGTGGDGLTYTVCLLAATQQFVYGLVFLLVLVFRVHRSRDAIVCQLTEAWGGVPPASVSVGVVSEFKRQQSVWWPLFTETAVRSVLTQFQKFVLAAYVSLSDQGVFDTVNGLGALVVRTVFRVLEDGAYNIWAAQMGFEKRPNDVRAGVPLLGSLLRICGYVGILAVSMATRDVLRYALYVLFSSRWATDEAVDLLQWMCWYIPLLGANGQLEAFVRASSTPATFAKVRNAMMLTSLLSIGLSVYLIKAMEWGSVGLMIASVVSVAVRIVVSVWFMASSSLTWDELIVSNQPLIVMGSLSVLCVGVVRYGLLLVGDLPLQLSLTAIGRVGCCAGIGMVPLAVLMVIVESISGRPLLPSRLLILRRVKA